MSKPGFELQWKAKLDNQPRGVHGLWQGVTASGVTLFVPMSLVTGSSNNDLRDRQRSRLRGLAAAFRRGAAGARPRTVPAASRRATRIVPLDARPRSARRPTRPRRRGLSQPARQARRGRAGRGPRRPGRRRSSEPAGCTGAAARRSRRRTRDASLPASSRRRRRKRPPADRIPGSSRGPMSEAERTAEAYGYGFLFRPSGVVYVVTSDGMLHVLGLPSGKDMQRPAPFLPANARWSSPIAVGTTMYAATLGNCGGAPTAIWRDRSRQRRETGGVVEDERRAGRRRRGVHAGRHADRRDRCGPDHW